MMSFKVVILLVIPAVKERLYWPNLTRWNCSPCQKVNLMFVFVSICLVSCGDRMLLRNHHASTWDHPDVSILSFMADCNCFAERRMLSGDKLALLDKSNSSSKPKHHTNRNGKIIGVIMLMDWFNVSFSFSLAWKYHQQARPGPDEKIISILQLVYHVSIVV